MSDDPGTGIALLPPDHTQQQQNNDPPAAPAIDLKGERFRDLNKRSGSDMPSLSSLLPSSLWPHTPERTVSSSDKKHSVWGEKGSGVSLDSGVPAWGEQSINGVSNQWKENSMDGTGDLLSGTDVGGGDESREREQGVFPRGVGAHAQVTLLFDF